MTKIGAVMALVAFILLAAIEASASAFSCTNVFRKAWFDEIDFSQIEKTLSLSDVVQVVSVKEYLRSQGKNVTNSNGTSPAFVVTLKDGTKGVFKPLGERNTPDVLTAEVAAYKMSELLGLHIVPPTVLRRLGADAKELAGIEGSFQYFVETKIDVFSGNKDDSLKHIPKNEWTKANLLHFVTGQWDRHDGNFLVDNYGRLVVIDNGAMNSVVQWKLGDFPFVKRGGSAPKSNDPTRFPFENPSVLKNPSEQELKQKLGHILGPRQRQIIIDRLLPLTPDRRLEYVIWKGDFYAKRFGGRKQIRIKSLPENIAKRINEITIDDLRANLTGLVSDSKLNEILTRLTDIQ